MPRPPRTFELSPKLIATYAGGPVVCLAPGSEGRSFRLHVTRPESVARIEPARRADVIGSDGQVVDETPADVEPPAAIMRVDIMGILEQRAGYHDVCGGWSDGHDAIAERMIMALEQGDVLLVVDSPGGAAAGLQEAVRRVLEEKAEHGRKVIGFVDEMCGSAAYWWAAAVCDELYLPPAGMVGSIGARSAHVSIAGALAQEGVAPTYFAWPGPGKVAFAPELPLSDVGKARGERDVMIAGEAFAAAVVEARGIDRESIVELDADCLTGQAAVDAGLADGVASIEDVIGYTLALAAAGKDQNMTTAAKDGTPIVRTEDDADEEEKAPSGTEPDTACKRCGSANEENSKFCDQCGAPMAAAPIADEADEEDEAPPASDPAPKPDAPPAPPAKQPPPRPDERSTASVAGILGLRDGASPLAIKSAVLAQKTALDRMMTATETDTPDAAVGVVLAAVGDSKRLAAVEIENKALRKSAEYSERLSLLRKLGAANLAGYSRSELFVDNVDEVTGARTVAPAPVYREMKLATLRSLVATKLANGTPAKASPFQPDAKAIDPNAVRVTEQDRVWAERHNLDPEAVARSRVALFHTNRAGNGATGV